MEKYTLTKDVPVFGFQVKSFPEGVGDAFDTLMRKIEDGKQRAYYGVSKMDDKGAIVYYADAEEKIPGEAEKYKYERKIIPRGDYLAETIHDWHNPAKLACIKDVFHAMMQDRRVDNTKPCIEWYKTEAEMLCMIQMDPDKELFASIESAANELLALLLPLSEAQLNTIPFKGSWTAAQLATHVTKSNNGIAQALEMKGKPAGRNPEKRVKELQDTFLNFSIKLQSPPFIIPEEQQYKKEAVTDALKKSNEHLMTIAIAANPKEIINLPAAFGEITKLELFHFVLYHTQRHIHQLKNVIRHI